MAERKSPKLLSTFLKHISAQLPYLIELDSGPLITCIYNLNSYLISLTFMLILCNYDSCYLNFMNFLHWYAIKLKFIFMHKLGIIMCFLDD